MKKIEGYVCSGGGNSSKWMPKLVPWLYPGTLNIKLKENKPKIIYTQVITPKNEYPIKLSPCKINGYDGFVVFREIFDWNKANEIEVAAKFRIREKFNLKDGDSLEIEFLKYF